MNTEDRANPDTPDATPAGDGWLQAMDRIADEDGYLEHLGPAHWAFFAEDAPILLVTFESAAVIRARPDHLPAGYELAKARGWSHLCLIADGPTWYRDRAVYGYFDRLVDDAFFEDFDQVIFHGAEMGAYAACAFSVVAPGASVLALSPRATLDPALAGWDDRDRAMRRLNFTDRYGYAPDMTEGTGHVWLVHDSASAPDAMHAALFRAGHVTPLSARYCAGRIGGVLDGGGMLGLLLDAIAEGRMDAQTWARVWRGRRDSSGYLRALLQRVQDNGRAGMEIRLLRLITQRMNAPRLARRLGALLARDAARGEGGAEAAMTGQEQPGA